MVVLRAMAVVTLVAACGGGDGDARWTGTVDTLPNGALRVANPRRGIWEGGRPWRLAPALVLGKEEEAGPTLFSAISGLQVDAAGRIYVLDRQANELRIFTRDGAHVRSVGREGGGPGEYSNANGLAWLADDTLVVVDQRGNRYTVLTAEGDYVRMVPRRLSFYGWTLTGGLDGDRIYERWYVGGEGEEWLVLIGTALQEQFVPPERDRATAAGGEDVLLASAPDTLRLPPMSGALYEAFSVRTARGGMSFSVPFAPHPVFHLDGRGSVWHGHGSAFRILRSSLAGDTLAEILLDVEPAPVTAADLADWEASDIVKQFRDLGGRLDLGRIPKVKPYFDDLYVDPEGHLWVSVPGASGGVVFRVFDPDGRYLGPLQLTGLERLRWVPIVVRNGRLHLVGQDELDVQRVYVFEIQR
jgi:6-bladed beta-propeller